ncbi:hypothetical protein VaNZ11_015836 [Volvox africanus]|uniref:Glycerophosphodiester phosphodiesterase n=1 Tax=Volvox africanus TaxID=51714 RepID=A0ABQ5SMI1_9CHLO|nr:hypothetical protein VaNZ11_015836 [Volvox africanus]
MPVHGTFASIRTWLDHSFSVLIKFWRELSARTRPHSLLGAQARWQHSPPRHQQGRLQQMALGGVLAMFVLALLYFDSGSSRRRASTAVVLPKSSLTSEGQVPLNIYPKNSAADDKALCRALSQMQVCSHRSSLGQSDKVDEAPLLERMARLAASGIVCYDIDVTATADGQLVVGHPSHIVTELRSAGRMVAPGQLDTMPWSEYVSAGLDKRHPLLQEVLAVFTKIVKNSDLGQDVGYSGGVGRETAGAGNDAASEVVGATAAGTTERGEADGGVGGGEVGSEAAQSAEAVALTDILHGGIEAVAQGVQQEEEQLRQQEGEEGVTVVPTQGQEQKDGLDKHSEQQKQKQRRQGRRPPALGAQMQQQQQQERTKSTDVVEEHQQQQKRDQQQRRQQVGQGQGRRRLHVLQEHGGDKAAARQQHQQKGADAQGQEQEQGQGQGITAGWDHPTALLLVELKDSALRVSVAEAVHNATQVLGIQSRVGLWLPRVGRVEGPSGEQSGGQGDPIQTQTQAVLERLQQLGSGLLKVLGLPDISRLTNGTRLPLPLMLQHGDATTYDMFGPSIMHSDAALAEVITAAEGRPVVTWVVDTIDEAMRVARAGGGLIVANEPLLMRSRLHAASTTCSGAVDGEAARAEKGKKAWAVERGN